ncbi:HlyD family secretion protein [Ruegeria conchae]|uniref:HlyD family secretion protein n=1 Tax=Ruegeria conchae TaxID=981384 RepID=UPI0029C68240|nr:HlyD family secretion protein [Ruegeria conchae]
MTQEQADKSTNRTTAFVLAVLALLFVWYLVADRVTPYTSSGRVKMFTVPVVSDVSGFVVEVPVSQNALVEAGQTLLQLETTRFETAVEVAEAALDATGQSLGANTANVATATARLTKARSQLEEVRTQAARIFELEQKGVYAKARGDQARAEIETAEADVLAAEAELTRSREQLGPKDADNPQIRQAVAALAEARLNLERTQIRAPMKSVVGNLQIDAGFYVSGGKPVMTLISGDEIWIEANLSENNLSNVKQGDHVSIAFDAFPGQLFEGQIRSVAVGVSTGEQASLGALPVPEETTGWLRSAQMYPVIIETTNYELAEGIRQGAALRLNARANVMVFTRESGFWNALGALWIRLVSWSLYLY